MTIAERRAKLWRASMWGGGAFWTIVVAGSAAFVYGASKRDPVLMAGAPALVCVTVAAIALLVAHRAAAQRFFFGFARSIGLLYVPSTRLLPMTPLLGAGDRRRVEHWMEGDLGDGVRGGLGHFVWQELKEDGESSLVREHHRYTICVIPLDESIALFRGVCLHPRRGVFPAHSDWLEGRAKRKIELESSALTDRYDLRLFPDQDEVVLRRLFSPKLVSWFASHPLTPGMEIRGGTLVVFVEKALDDEGNLVFLLDAARHIAAAVRGEISEEAARAA